MGVGPVGFDVEQQALIWAMWRRGDAIREMESTLGETLPRIRRYLRESGGIPPIPRRRRVGHLTLVEREEISRGIAAGLSGRTIAERIDRPSSTVSREIARNGGRGAYRALVADAAAFERARRPKSSKLAAGPLAAAGVPEITTAITHLREVLGEATYESLARKGETMTTAAMATYAYDQIDQARTTVEHPS